MVTAATSQCHQCGNARGHRGGDRPRAATGAAAAPRAGAAALPLVSAAGDGADAAPPAGGVPPASAFAIGRRSRRLLAARGGQWREAAPVEAAAAGTPLLGEPPMALHGDDGAWLAARNSSGVSSFGLAATDTMAISAAGGAAAGGATAGGATADGAAAGAAPSTRS